MFAKLVAIEPVSLIPSAEEALRQFAETVVMYADIPATSADIVARIGDADAVLLSYTSTLTAEILEQCPCVRYIGMCCSLYSPESANVDIRYAEAHGITVTGIRDYGDEGVVEYVVSELVRLLHGFGEEPWSGVPSEITGLKVGVVGLGKSGGMIADAMRFFGADIAYYARGEKTDAAAKGFRYMELGELLAWSDVVCCCLNKNTILLHEEQLQRLGSHKVVFNTGLSPAWDEEPMLRWLEAGDNRLCCDTVGALGGTHLLAHPQVRCMGVSTGRTRQAFDRLSEKVLANIKANV